MRRCLEKDPAERFQSAKDVAFALEAESGTSRSAPRGAAIRPRRRWLAASAVGLGLLLAGAAAGLLYARRVGERPLPKITQLTFRRGVVDRARFTPDGKTVVYSAFWDGHPPEIFTTRVESPESRSLGLPPARLMSVSSTSELAILLPAPGDLSDLTTGTLARVPLSGGEPRKVLDDVYNADWSPDGRELAVIRRAGPVGGFYGREFQLEYPIGTVLARSVGPWLRVSPRGDRVAVSDLSGIAVYDRAGRRTSVQSPPVVQMLAWDPDGGLWLSGGEKWRARSLWWANQGGPPREVYRATGSLGLHDVSADGRLLLNDGFERVGVRAKGPREEAERELGVFSWTWVVDLSADGSRTLLCEGDSPGRAETRAYVVPTRGGLPVRLGEGTPLALSPEGTWALVASSSPRPRLVVTPTGPGEPRTVLSDDAEWDPTSSLEPPWFLDEARLLLHAAAGGHRSRTVLVDLSGGEPRPVTPEGVVSVRGSDRDGAVVGIGHDGALARYPLRGGEPQPLVARLPPGGIPLRASGDGRFVFVGRAGMPYRVDRLELATGRLTPWKALQPDDLTGVTHVVGAALTADGRTYAYTYGRYFLDLFLVEGLRP